MDDIASLGLRIDAAQANTAAVALDKMASAGGRAEKTANKLATAERGVEKATGAAADAAMDAVRAAKALAGEQEAVIKTANRLNAAHGSAVGSSKALTQATLNMTRQFADVGVTAAMGMNPLMIMIQQGPQIADAFQMAAAQGLGFTTVLAGLGTQLGLVKVSGGALASAQFVQAEAAVADAVAKQAAAMAGANLAASNLALAASAAVGAEGQAALAIATAGDTVAKEAATAATKQLTAANATLATSAGAVGTATKFAFGPVLAILLPIAAAAAAVGAVFALSARQINQGNKDLASGLGLTADQLEKVKNKTVTMGDVAIGTFNAAKGALAEAFGPQLDAAGKAIDKFFAEMAANTVKEAKAIVGGFMGAFAAVKATWAMLPAAFGDATVRAAQAALDGLAKLINGAVGLINPLIAGMNERFKLNIPQLDTVKFAQLQNSYAGQMEATAKVGAEAFAKGSAEGAALVDKALAAIESESLKAAEKRMRAEAGKAKAVRDTVSDYEKAAKASQEYLASLTEEVATMGMSTEQLKRREIAMKAALAPTEELARAIRIAGANWEYQNGVMKAYEAQTKAVTAASNDNIKTMAQVLGSVEMDTALDGLIHDLEAIQRQSDIARNAVDDIYYGIRNRDWAGAFSGLLRTIDQLKIAFDKTADAKSRLGAIAGVAQGVGGAIGGTAGNAISGVASGAVAGYEAGGKSGGIIGGLLGGILSLFGSSSAKKKAKAEEAARKAEAEAQRLAEEQARLQAVANEARALEIQKIELTFGALAAEVARREDVLKAMDATNQAAQKEVWALQDAAAAKARDEAVAAEAAQRASDIAATRHDLEIQLLEAQGKASEAAKMRLADERALLDEGLQNLFDQVQAERELTATRDAATAAAADAARAEEERVAAMIKSAADLRTAQQSDAANLVSTAKQQARAAYDAQVSEIKAGRDQMAGYAASFREFRLGLSGAAESGANFYTIAAKARLGDKDAMGQLLGAAQAANTSAMSGASTQVEFLREQARISAAVQAAEDTAGRQVSIADQQLSALEAQVSGLITVNESVLTVAAAIAGLQSALKVQTGTFGGAVANPNRNWGANADANMLLARQGYGGDFGGGGFQAWAEQQPESVKATLRQILSSQGQSYRAAFATGGSFTVGGDGGTDTTPVSFMATKNEVVNVSREDVMARMAERMDAMVAEMRAMRSDAHRTANASEKTANTLVRVTRDGDALVTEAA